MENSPERVFLNTRKNENLIFRDADIVKFVAATHCCRYPEAKGLLRIDPKYYKTHKDKSYIAFGLMTLGGYLIKKNEIKEAALAYLKAYQIDPENTTVQKFCKWCSEPKSVEDVARVIRKRKNIREKITNEITDNKTLKK